MVKLDKSGLLKKIEKLQELDNSTITYGIFGDKANQLVNDGGKITVGHLARIHEEGRSYRHKGGNIAITGANGDVRHIHIKAGTIITIPSRPFFTNARIKIRTELAQILVTQFKLLWNNKNNVNNFLNQIGKYAKQTIMFEIQNGEFYPLGELQAFKKGNMRELIDSGQMMNAVDYQIKA